MLWQNILNNYIENDDTFRLDGNVTDLIVDKLISYKGEYTLNNFDRETTITITNRVKTFLNELYKKDNNYNLKNDKNIGWVIYNSVKNIIVKIYLTDNNCNILIRKIGREKENDYYVLFDITDKNIKLNEILNTL